MRNDLSRPAVPERKKALIQSQVSVARNYGALLQAYALQTVLRMHGVDPVTNAAIYDHSSVRAVLGDLRWLLRHRTLDGRPTPAMWRRVTENLATFAQTHVHTPIRYLSAREVAKLADAGRFSIAVSGSDQVWRPLMADVLGNAFKGCPSDISRIAYAASFGLPDAREFSDELHSEFGKQLRQFDAVSVREDSGVDICCKEWDVNAVQVVDPTMLLPVEFWDSLCRDGYREEKARVVYAVLDSDRLSEEAAAEHADSLGAELRSLFPPLPNSRRAFRDAPSAFVMPPVEDWLGSIRDADLVITDSFHVTVFSVMFSTPFVVLRNDLRGNERIASLARMLGLGDRTVDVEKLRRSDLPPDPSWDRVHEAMAVKRKESAAFLASAIEQPQ